MKPQTPDYRFPDMDTAYCFGVIARTRNHYAGILARVTAAVVTACPEACPIDTFATLKDACIHRPRHIARTYGHPMPEPTPAMVALKATMVGMSIVAGHEPPPTSGAMAA